MDRPSPRHVWLLYIHSLAKYQRDSHLLDRMSLYGYAVEELAIHLRGLPDLAGAIEVVPDRIDALHDFRKLVLAARLDAAPPILLGLSCYDWNLQASLDWLVDFRAAWPSVPVVIGGPSASDPAGIRALTPLRLDYVVPGEGELVLAPIIRHVLAGGAAEDLDPGLPVSVPGRSDTGALSNRRRFVEDIDNLPSVCRTSFVREMAPMAILQTSRGCDHGCSYCAFNKRPLEIGRASCRERV